MIPQTDRFLNPLEIHLESPRLNHSKPSIGQNKTNTRIPASVCSSNKDGLSKWQFDLVLIVVAQFNSLVSHTSLTHLLIHTLITIAHADPLTKSIFLFTN